MPPSAHRWAAAGYTHPDPAFRQKAEELKEESFKSMRTLLLTRRAEISHENPEMAVEFALVNMAFTLRGWILENPPRKLLLAKSDNELALQLSRGVLAYLGSTSQ